MQTSVRFKTLEKLCGGLSPNCGGSLPVDRMVTVMDAGYGLVGFHRVDTSYRFCFVKPIPRKYEGMRVVGLP